MLLNSHIFWDNLYYEQLSERDNRDDRSCIQIKMEDRDDEESSSVREESTSIQEASTSGVEERTIVEERETVVSNQTSSVTVESLCKVCEEKVPKARVHYGGVCCYSCRAFFR